MSKGFQRKYPVKLIQHEERFDKDVVRLINKALFHYLLWARQGASTEHNEFRRALKELADKPFYLNKQGTWGSVDHVVNPPRLSEAAIKKLLIGAAMMGNKEAVDRYTDILLMRRAEKAEKV
jgi:hypothetical protein